MNNGKRIDRFNSKKNKKDALKSINTAVGISSLLQNGLLQFDFEGELKAVPSSNPGWSLLDQGDGKPLGDNPNTANQPPLFPNEPGLPDGEDEFLPK